MIIPINVNNSGYDIVLERGALNKTGEYLNLKRKVLIVTDSGVPAVYSETLAKNCLFPVIVTINQGEESKCFDNYKALLSKMLEHSFTRKDCVVAVGGGVVGDLSGFVASTYMRGVDFYNVPTTFLSQVDSSIGGKVAIDFNGIKNIVGAFYQPKKVIIDPDVLKTLSQRQLSAGICESIKMAATYDKELFEMLEDEEGFDKNTDEIIRRSLLIKKDVVEKDPTEKGLRMVLNFGHTVGHAIESSKAGSLLHGECVGIGMLALCGKAVRDRLVDILKKYRLPTQTDFDKQQVLSFIIHDKKATADGINVVYVDKIGSFEFKKATKDDLAEYLEKLL